MTALSESGSLLHIKFVEPGGAVMLRPRICSVLSLLRIHSPDCKHCMARLTYGNELRKRLEELSEPTPSYSHILEGLLG